MLGWFGFGAKFKNFDDYTAKLFTSILGCLLCGGGANNLLKFFKGLS